ncbi:hypothetical protein MKX01_021546, partial [Papaver californicum]
QFNRSSMDGLKDTDEKALCFSELAVIIASHNVPTKNRWLWSSHGMDCTSHNVLPL